MSFGKRQILDSMYLSLHWSQTATEIRCEEKSKGGLRYEVILAEPVADRPPSPQHQQSNRPFSEEDIDKKLLAAKERREVMLGATILMAFFLMYLCAK